MSQMFPCGIPKSSGVTKCPKHGFPIDCEKAIRANRDKEAAAAVIPPAPETVAPKKKKSNDEGK